MYLEQGEVLYEPEAQVPYIYFPVDCIVAQLYVTQAGKTAGVSMTGKEGLIGIAKFMGGENTPHRAFVQCAGYAYRLPAHLLIDEFDRHKDFHMQLMCYIQSLILQMSFNAVCYRHHTVQEQLCRWLLLSLDRLPGNELVITQEMIASLLGVRREGITEAVGKLQKQGIIQCCRGHIKVLNRSALEDMGCECYGVVRSESDRLLLSRPRAHLATAGVRVA